MHVISECENVIEGKNYGICLNELPAGKTLSFSYIFREYEMMSWTLQVGPARPPRFLLLYGLLQVLQALRIMLYECCVSLAGVSFCKFALRMDVNIPDFGHHRR
jgi:hypothetical protein